MSEPIDLFRALSSDQRLKIFRLINGRTLCVNAITARLELTQSAVSQHLKVLKDAGLVTATRCGYRTHYTVDQDAVEVYSRAISKLLEAK